MLEFGKNNCQREGGANCHILMCYTSRTRELFLSLYPFLSSYQHIKKGLLTSVSNTMLHCQRQGRNLKSNQGVCHFMKQTPWQRHCARSFVRGSPGCQSVMTSLRGSYGCSRFTNEEVQRIWGTTQDHTAHQERIQKIFNSDSKFLILSPPTFPKSHCFIEKDLAREAAQLSQGRGQSTNRQVLEKCPSREGWSLCQHTPCPQTPCLILLGSEVQFAFLGRHRLGQPSKCKLGQYYLYQSATLLTFHANIWKEWS